MILAGAQQINIDQTICLHGRIRAVNCQKCQEACPNQSLSVDYSNRVAPISIKEDRCSGCGLCVSACPAGAIVLFREPHNFELKNGLLELVCSKLKPDSSIACLGMLDAYGFAYLGVKAEQVTVGFDTERCEQCNPGVVAAVKQRIEQANCILRKLGKKGHTGELAL